MSFKRTMDKAIRILDEKTYSVEHAPYPGGKKNISYVKASSEKEAANKVQGVVYKVKAIDSKADLTGATTVGNGYVKDSGSEWIVYDVNGNIIGRFATYDEAVRKAKEL